MVDEDALVIDCYRLARVYRQNPEVFLAMPLSDVALHLYRTSQLLARTAKKDDDDD